MPPSFSAKNLQPRKKAPARPPSSWAAWGCEGAIPFATADPLRVIPAYVVGAAAGCATAFFLGCLNHAPWGGLIVLPVVDGRLAYLSSALLGALVVALITGLTRKPREEKPQEDTTDDEITFEDF